ncbi:MAG TPA: branched-chain-amino-acid transaminase [Dissulfurispiraceae bacterium]|nr:branched-chain-amino-acid transaminase [Dissulfurispiraceae bacterium]
MKVFIDGNIMDGAAAKISVLDHGLLYGDGVFEGIRMYNGKVFKLREHVSRLFASAKAIMLTIPMSETEMEQAILETVRAEGQRDGYIRPIITRGSGCLGIDPTSCSRATVIIIVDNIRLYPAELYEKGMEVVSVATRRISSDGLDPRIKSLNYLNNVLAKIEARRAGCHEAVMLNREGYVAECSADNIAIVRDGSLLTPAVQCGALDGITMQTVLDLARLAGIPHQRAFLTRYDLYTADECFLTGTGAEIMPVTMIDGRTIGDGVPGRISALLRAKFERFVREDLLH